MIAMAPLSEGGSSHPADAAYDRLVDQPLPASTRSAMTQTRRIGSGSHPSQQGAVGARRSLQPAFPVVSGCGLVRRGTPTGMLRILVPSSRLRPPRRDRSSADVTAGLSDCVRPGDAYPGPRSDWAACQAAAVLGSNGRCAGPLWRGRRRARRHSGQRLLRRHGSRRQPRL